LEEVHKISLIRSITL